MHEYTKIAREALIAGDWYVGRGRNGNIGLWDGVDFIVLAKVGKKAGPSSRDWKTDWGVKREPYFDAEHGCFQPFRRVEMGVIGLPLDEPGYALTMRFAGDC